MSHLLIRQAQCYRSGEWKRTDVRVREGVIVAIGDRLPVEHGVETVIEADGKALLPGLIDMHVHLREPGFEGKETIATGSRAAARGGFTTIAAMPNTQPAIDSGDKIREQLARAKKDAVVKVHFYGAITKGLAGKELADFKEMKDAGALALTDDGVGIQTAGQMEAAMKRAVQWDLPIVAHCEDDSLAGAGVIHEGHAASRLGLPGIPGEAEAVHVARDALLAGRTGARYHVCHVSSAASVQAIRDAKSRGVRISAEVTPHHLVLTEDDIAEDDAAYKMNPPLRSTHDRAALMTGLLDGTIDFIATDHAPHEVEEKARGFLHAPFGVIGLETAFPLLYTRLVKPGLMRLEELVARMSAIPAACFNLEGGSVAEGQAADLTLVDLDKERVVDPSDFYSQSTNSPFVGWRLAGWPVWTMVDGRIVYDARKQGEMTDAETS